jgi:hypothetical protein
MTMAKITVLTSKEITVWYHEESRIVHHELHRYPGAAALEAALERGLSVLVEHGGHRWLSDDRKGGALPKSHHEWAETDWGPRAASAGWKYWALIPPVALLGQMNMEHIKEIYAALGVKVCAFTNPTEARAWLAGCPD